MGGGCADARTTMQGYSEVPCVRRPHLTEVLMGGGCADARTSARSTSGSQGGTS